MAPEKEETMSNKVNKNFNPKIYLGRDRIYRTVPKAHNIYRLLVWDKDKLEDDSPRNYARRKTIYP